MVFRSGTLDRLSSENVDELIESHKINTILDLRTRYGFASSDSVVPRKAIVCSRAHYIVCITVWKERMIYQLTRAFQPWPWRT